MKSEFALIFIFTFSAHSQGVNSSKTGQSGAVPAAASAGSSTIEEPEEGYQVDYEEEPDSELEPPTKKKATKKTALTGKLSREADKTVSTQGSRAKNRFVFPAKSETKSVYKKNGAPLDVDTD